MTKPTPIQNPSVSLSSRKESDTLDRTKSANMAGVDLVKQSSDKKLNLEKWAQSIVSPKQDPSSALNLSHFGLKSAQDIITFMKTPLGKSTIAEQNEKIAIKKAQIEEQMIQQREHQRHMHRLKAFLFLWFVGKKAHSADMIKEINRLVQEKLLHKKPYEKQDSYDSKARMAQNEALLEAINYYEKALHTLDEQEKLTKAEEVFLEQLLSVLDLQQVELLLKHQIYKNSLTKFEHLETDQVNKPELDKHLDDLTTKIAAHAEKVSHAIASEDKDATHLMHHHHGLNLEMAALKEIIDIHLGAKRYVDDQGQAVTSFKKAHFILQLDQKIIKHDNKYYLLDANQDWSTMSQQDKQQARLDYKSNKHDLMCIKQQLVYNEAKEKKALDGQIEETKTKLEDNKIEQQLIANQRNLIQASRADAQNALNQSQLNQDTLAKPTPTAGAPSTPKPSQTSATLVFRAEVLKLRQSDKALEHKDLMKLASLAPMEEQLKIKAFLKDLPKTHEPAQTQKFFKNFLNSISLEASAPAMTKLQDQDRSSYYTPNPFKTKPSPFNKTS